MNQSFCMASDLETRQTMWAAIHTNGTPIYVMNEPVVYSSVELAGHYAFVFRL
jgi:hypothetical protein